MKWVRLVGGGRGLMPLLCMLFLCSFCTSVQAEPRALFPGNNYCSVPPFPASGVKSNLLILFDNSASMADLAYVNDGQQKHCSKAKTICTTNADCPSGQTCRGSFIPSTYCFDNSYSETTSYDGYFDRDRIYNYKEDLKRFEPGGTIYACSSSGSGSGSECFATGGFLSLTMTGSSSSSGSTREAQNFNAKGNFLNWLTTSKLDLAKKVLTGGKFRADASGQGGVLVGETRGCQGKKMIKMVPGLSKVAFAVGGEIPAPLPTSYMYENRPSSGGDTRIEVFDYQFSSEPCTQAVTDWLAGNKSSLEGDLAGCIGDKKMWLPQIGTVKPLSTVGMYITSRLHCYVTPRTYAEFQTLCATRNTYDPNPPRYRGDDICAFEKDEAGFNTYCAGLSDPPVIDPSRTARSATGADMPAFIHDIAVHSLCNVNAETGSFQAEPCYLNGKMFAHVYLDSPPTGLIQEFSNDINFGAMIFNDSGAPWECSDPTAQCPDSKLRDWSKVTVPLGSPLGDHTASSPAVIPSIDQITTAAWTPLAEAFYSAIGYFANRSDKTSCQRNNVLIVSDGISTADRHPAVNAFVTSSAQKWVNAADGMPAGMTTPADGPPLPPSFRGSYNLDDLAWIARHKNIANSGDPIVYNKDYISTYVVYTGAPCDIYYNADGTCMTTDEGVPEKLMQLTAAKGGGRIARSKYGAELASAFRAVLQDIAAGSGTDPSIFSTGDGNGAVFLQEQFYPTKSFDDGKSSAYWIGEMESLWYYIDPFIGGTAGAGSSIRQDDDTKVGSLTLNDNMVSLGFDAATNHAWAYLAPDADGNGIPDVPNATRVEPDQMKTLWRAGQQLWKRDVDVKGAPRTIYTPLLRRGKEISGTGMMSFSDSKNALTPYLGLQAGDPGADSLLRYVQGFDVTGDVPMRSRTLARDGIPATSSDPADTGVGVWKLGDIVSSTPQVQSRVPLGGYHLPPPSGYGDDTYVKFIGSDSYRGRGMVYVGANDGMLHAFNFGNLDTSSAGDVKATLTGTGIGNEQWAFIPTNALPYLKYLASPNYLHMYFVDGKTTLVDASIGDPADASSKETYSTVPKSPNSWRTVLIGGMGLGGATCGSGATCVQPPLVDPNDPDPQHPTKWVGYSSYFALDVTNPNKPILLWEFSDPALGYSTTGPAIVRIGDAGLNGRWFAVFGSGPTGTVETVKHSFTGTSGQNLQFFAVDLRTGRVANLKQPSTPITNAFAGSMIGAGIDADRWDTTIGSTRYQDDALYVGYTQVGTGVAWDGGVVRIVTKADPDPAQWQVTKVIDGVGPVTSGIARLQDRKNKNLWLYFGSGRYFFNQDDLSERRALYGIKEPCYNIRKNEAITKPNVLDSACESDVEGELFDQSGTPVAMPASKPGWRMNLYPAADGGAAERLFVTPVSTTSGAVFFSTYQPSTDLCSYGYTYVIGVRYDSGGVLDDAAVNGKALVQLSTGAVGEVDLFKGSKEDPRRSQKMTGMPGGLKIVTNSGLRPARKIIHIQER